MYIYGAACTYPSIGVEVQPHGVEAPCVIKVYVIAGTFDLPARASVLNCIQFNGKYGCSFCEQPGMTVRTEKGGSVHSYPYNLNDPTGPARTHEDFIKYAKQAVEQNLMVVICVHININLHSLRSSIPLIDQRISQIEVPSEIRRKPRGLKELKHRIYRPMQTKLNILL